MAKNMFANLNSIVADTLTESIKMIDIDELHSSPDNFFAIERVEEFAETILGQGGVKDNLVVRPLAGGGYEIVSGHRRKAAVELLLDRGENISRYLPCLIQDYADEDDRQLDLILMNISARRLSDSELWKSYEIVDTILTKKKEKGVRFGRIRETLAGYLGVSPAQVGKLQNVEKNAIGEVKAAVENGDISISTANEIAKLDEGEQEELIRNNDVGSIKHKNIKKKNAAKAAPEKTETEKVDTYINFQDDEEFNEDEAEVRTEDTDIVTEVFKFDRKKIEFYNDEHFDKYLIVRELMGGSDRDPYRAAVAYLIALDRVLYEHMRDIFDFDEGVIKLEVLNKGWQTGTSMKTTRLAFNLWNGCYDDGETYIDKDGYETELPSSCYSPEQIFNCAEYAPYYWQAIKLRFEY